MRGLKNLRICLGFNKNIQCVLSADDESDFEDGLIRKKVKKGALLFSDDSYENSTVGKCIFICFTDV